MDDLIFCPACLIQKKRKLSLVGIKDKMLEKVGPKSVYYCAECKNYYPLSATLLSEDVVRSMIKNSNEDLNHLLEELELYK